MKNKKNRVFNEIYSAISLIESNLTNPLTIKEITSQSSLSHWEFQRLFSSVTGIPISKYQKSRRLSESLESIKKNSARIIDIAFEYQFNSPDSFTRAFKRHFRFTPLEWRNNEKKISSYKINKITKEELGYYFDKIQRTPVIEHITPKLLLGKEVKFRSHFTDDSDCSDIVVPLWKEVYPLLRDYQNRIDDKLYGLAYCEDLKMDSVPMKYYASIGVSGVPDIPNDFKVVNFLGGLYAKFEKKGLADKTSNIINYIYGIWLPGSNYERREGPDFELFDYRYNLSDPNSLSYFLVPVMLKN